MKTSIALTILINLIAYQLVGQDFSIQWKYNPNNQTRSLNTSDNFNYAVFISYKNTGTASLDVAINILNNNGQLIGKYGMGEWPEPREVLIANDGNIYALISALFSRTGYILAISKKGELLWSKKLEQQITDIDITANGEYICLSSRNELFLFDGDGKKIWNYSFGKEFEYSFEKISISNDASFIVTYEMNNKKVYTFDSNGDGKWGFDSPDFNGYCLNKAAKILGIINLVDDQLWANSGYKTVQLLNTNGGIIKSSVGSLDKDWREVEVSYTGDVVLISKDMLGKYGLQYYSRDEDWKSKNYWYYGFEPPAGFHKNFTPEVRVSNDGSTIIFSDGFEIYCFKKEQLEKRW